MKFLSFKVFDFFISSQSCCLFARVRSEFFSPWQESVENMLIIGQDANEKRLVVKSKQFINRRPSACFDCSIAELLHCRKHSRRLPNRNQTSVCKPLNWPYLTKCSM